MDLMGPMEKIVVFADDKIVVDESLPILTQHNVRLMPLFETTG